MHRVAVDVLFHIDLRGFLGVRRGAAGLHTIEGTASITADADLEALEQPKAAVDAHCPVLYMLKAVPTTLTLVKTD